MNKKQIADYGLLHMESDEIMYDLQRQDSYGRHRNLSYLTQRTIDYELLQVDQSGKFRKQSSLISPTPFAHMLPVIDRVPVKQLLKLRQSEQPAFDQYREAVAKSLKEAVNLPQNEQKELFNDVIRPEIQRIDISIDRSRKILNTSLAQDTVLLLGSIAIGMFGTFSQSHFGYPAQALALGAAGGLGGVHYTRRMAKNIASRIGDSKEAIESRYYFLWKISKS